MLKSVVCTLNFMHFSSMGHCSQSIYQLRNIGTRSPDNCWVPGGFLADYLTGLNWNPRTRTPYVRLPSTVFLRLRIRKWKDVRRWHAYLLTVTSLTIQLEGPHHCLDVSVPPITFLLLRFSSRRRFALTTRTRSPSQRTT